MMPNPLLAVADVLIILAIMAACVLFHSKREDKTLLARIEAVQCGGSAQDAWWRPPSLTRKVQRENEGRRTDDGGGGVRLLCRRGPISTR